MWPPNPLSSSVPSEASRSHLRSDKFDRVATSDPLTWPTVVILDHPAVPKIDLEPAADVIGVLTQPGATDHLFALVEDPDSVPPIPASVLDAVVAEFGELPVKAML